MTVVCGGYNRILIEILNYMNKMADKRDRSSNFTEADKELLMGIVADYFEIVENKRTDGTTVKQKNEAWETITHLFNATSINENRTPVQLKYAYNNMKRKLKKENAEEKMEVYKTGGEPASQSKVTGTKGRLLSLLKPQIEPLYNAYDSSAEYINMNVTEEPIVLPHEKIVSPEETILLSLVEEQPSTSSEVPMVTEHISINETLTPTQTATPGRSQGGTGRKRKAKLVDIYTSVENFTKTKTMKNDVEKKKSEVEMAILLLKKKREEEKQDIHFIQMQIEKEKLEQEKEKLQQEKLKTEQEKLKREQEEVKLLIEKEKFKCLLKDINSDKNK